MQRSLSRGMSRPRAVQVPLEKPDTTTSLTQGCTVSGYKSTEWTQGRKQLSFHDHVDYGGTRIWVEPCHVLSIRGHW